MAVAVLAAAVAAVMLVAEEVGVKQVWTESSGVVAVVVDLVSQGLKVGRV
jgi:hypothetical protein